MAMIDEPIAAIEPPPAAKLYFDTGVSRLPFDGQSLLAPVITWLSDHPDATAVISGYHDPTGKQARNASLSKQRAESTFAAIVAAGIDASRLEMVKPISTDGGEDLAEARRVEVLIQ
jgi:outer membrane protein OmpA-like peptidoglycan-associated protein